MTETTTLSTSQTAALAAPGAEAEGVTIVVPSYNEERSMSAFLTELKQVVTELPVYPEVEVLVIDDGSADGTAAQVQPFVNEQIRLIRHDRNRGYGAAIKTGVANAKYRWILITDSDGTYPNDCIAPILAERARHDMVVGARIGKGAKVPLVRRPAKWALRLLASNLSGVRIPDLNSGLRVMRKDLLQEYAHILPDAFSYTTTITLVMLSGGHRVKYLPIGYLKREGRSKIRPFRDTVGFTKLIVRTVMYFDPLRVFVPVSFLFVLAAVLVGTLGWKLTGRVPDVTTVLLFTTGVQLLALGMLADTLNRRLR